MSRYFLAAVVVFLFPLASCTSSDVRDEKFVDAPENRAYDMEIHTFVGAVLQYTDGENCDFVDKCRGAIASLAADAMSNFGKCPDGYSIVNEFGFFNERSRVIIPIKCNEKN